MGKCFLVPLAGLGDVSENTSCFNVETSFNAENHYITYTLTLLAGSSPTA